MPSENCHLHEEIPLPPAFSNPRGGMESAPVIKASISANVRVIGGSPSVPAGERLPLSASLRKYSQCKATSSSISLRLEPSGEKVYFCLYVRIRNIFDSWLQSFNTMQRRDSGQWWGPKSEGEFHLVGLKEQRIFQHLDIPYYKGTAHYG